MDWIETTGRMPTADEVARQFQWPYVDALIVLSRLAAAGRIVPLNAHR